jgi:hypothetical protein
VITGTSATEAGQASMTGAHASKTGSENASGTATSGVEERDDGNLLWRIELVIAGLVSLWICG